MSDRFVCEWNINRPDWLQDGIRVVVDVADGTVTFEHCHRPRRFWLVRTDAVYSCQLEDLQALHLDWWLLNEPRHGRNATVSTPEGKAVFNSRMSGFREVVDVLHKSIGTNRGPLLDNPNIWFLGTVVLAVVISISGLIWALG